MRYPKCPTCGHPLPVKPDPALPNEAGRRPGEASAGFFRRDVLFPLWLWTAIWGIELLGSRDWGKLFGNAFALGAGFLYVIGRPPAPAP